MEDIIVGLYSPNNLSTGVVFAGNGWETREGAGITERAVVRLLSQYSHSQHSDGHWCEECSGMPSKACD